MIKSLWKFLLFGIPFFLAGAILFYKGLTATDTAVTSDGYQLKTASILMGTLFLVLPFAIVIGTLIFGAIKRRQIEDLLAHGKQGMATILSLSDTGTRINNQPRVKLLLEILVPNYKPYRAEKTITLSSIYMSQIQTGSVINVMVDPEQPDNQKRIGLMLK
jgi:hypothetical protein